VVEPVHAPQPWKGTEANKKKKKALICGAIPAKGGKAKKPKARERPGGTHVLEKEKRKSKNRLVSKATLEPGVKKKTGDVNREKKGEAPHRRVKRTSEA